MMYPCDECDYTTRSETMLSSHKQAKHEIIWHYCDQCEYKYKNKSEIERHKDGKHRNNKHFCDQCDKIIVSTVIWPYTNKANMRE